MEPAQVAAYAAQLQSQQQHQHQQLQPQPISMANPTPNHNHLVPSHPSYTEMITAAILWDNSQGKDSGSSKRAIAKYIDRVYTNLPPTHSALLTHHLKRLKNSGHLVMVKNSYQLPDFARPSPLPAVPIRSGPISQPFQPSLQAHQPPPVTSSVADYSVTPKRKQGRPPKAKQPEPEAQSQSGVQFQRYQLVSESIPGRGSSLVPVNGAVSGKRPRGRPPKGWNQNQQEVAVPFVQPISQVEPRQESNGQVQVNGGSVKRRGRPPKKQQLEQQEIHELVQAQPAYNHHVSVNNVEVVKRRPGRPAKANVGPRLGARMGVRVGLGVGRGRGRPKKINNVLGPVSDSVGKKRGWPPGKPRGKKFVGMAMAYAGALGKRRGRKPKESGIVEPKAEKSAYFGKPRGRPRKNFTLVKHTSEQGQEMANEELLRKLEDMQSKIREAVEVIRPHVSDQSAPDALSALQQLEHLSTMDVTASPSATAPPVIPVPIDVMAPPPSITTQETTATPSLTDPTMMAFTAPPESSVPLPFGMNVPLMTVTAPFSFENQQPVSWAPPSEGGL